VHECGEDRVSVLFEAVGEATRILSTRRTGDTLGIIGPLGRGFAIPRKTSARPALVAGGMGVAPLFFLAQELTRKGLKSLVLIGARSQDCLLRERQFRALGCEVRAATDDGSKGFHGFVTQLLERFLGKERFDIYGCGPAPMLRELCRVSAERGLRAQVSLEAHMSCGFGACLGCAVRTVSGYQRVCKEGPVFDASEVLWPNP
jgi:dihydroorotate dehydrogenase electron transfer subunit